MGDEEYEWAERNTGRMARARQGEYNRLSGGVSEFELPDESESKEEKRSPRMSFLPSLPAAAAPEMISPPPPPRGKSKRRGEEEGYSDNSEGRKRAYAGPMAFGHYEGPSRRRPRDEQDEDNGGRQLKRGRPEEVEYAPIASQIPERYSWASRYDASRVPSVTQTAASPLSPAEAFAQTIGRPLGGVSEYRECIGYIRNRFPDFAARFFPRGDQPVSPYLLREALRYSNNPEVRDSADRGNPLYQCGVLATELNRH